MDLPQILLLCILSYGATASLFDEVVFLESSLLGLPLGQDNETQYCYSFTWIKKDKKEFAPYVNKTCKDIFSTTRPPPFCVDPMVATEKATQPDMDNLYEQYFQKVTCNLHTGSVCAKYTYYYDGAPQNITRLCTKISVDGAPMTSGCITDTTGVYEREICACSSDAKEKPCNGVGLPHPETAAFVSIAIAFLMFKLMID